MRKRAVFVIAVIAMACHRQVEVGSDAPGPSPSPSPAPSVSERGITTAEGLLGAMHDRYAGRWYRTMTFVQTSTYYRADGTPSRSETWYEAGAMPGRLRIDLGDPGKGNGVVYRGDSVYTAQNGQIVDRRVGRNPLLILGFDVYAQPVSRTLEQLRAEKIDIDVIRGDTLDGRRVFVVGAGPMDSTSNQFWVDAERLLFLRLIQTDPQRHTTRDIRFDKYVRHGNGWVAEEVRMLAGGKLIFHEEYANVRVDVPLSDDFFVPEKWSTAPHWYKP